jgi:hypothetical protein
VCILTSLQAPFSKKRIKFAADAVAPCAADKVIAAQGTMPLKAKAVIMKINYKCEGIKNKN